MLDALRAALAASHPGWAGAPLVALPDSGLAHLHVRLQGLGLVARLPKQSQLGLAPEANLQHQAACFERAAPGGHTPRVHGVLPVSVHLPRGGLLVDDIVGRAPILPADLLPIAQALAALHALPLPAQQARAPLSDAADPLRGLLDEILGQMPFVAEAGLDAAVRTVIEADLQALQAWVDGAQRPPRSLISFDAHPGNFLVRDTGSAVLVDLEKCRYGPPGLDLAHATLYTSTTWDVASRAVLSPGDVQGFYAAWDEAAGAVLAAAARPWHLRLRRAMGLWSLTWCCKWRVLSHRPPGAPEQGEDWSAAASDPTLVAHVQDRVDHYLSPGAMTHMRDELRQLAEAWPA